MLEFDKTIAGMDEAGRGSLAGPVVAAAVILPKWTRLPGLTDSKLLSAAKREELFAKITKSCQYGVGIASHEEVDEFGLLHATYRAYKRAIEDLKATPDHLMIDGCDKFFFDIPHTSIIKGDLKIRAISAASVIAKVTRDRLMLEFAQKYPQYGFDLHKGYGTQRHQRALKEHGPSKIHRKSYAPLKSLKWVQKELL
jgi:ribonuclease HII